MGKTAEWGLTPGMKTGPVTFEPLREADLPLLHRWLNTPHVSQWWKVEGRSCPSAEVVRQKYLPRIEGKEPVDCYVISYDGRPIGMVQSCRLDDYPTEKEMYGLGERHAGIDICIGEEDYVHRGLGSGIIRKFVKEKIFANYNAFACIIDPDPQNAIAVKAYTKAGFAPVRTVWNEKDHVFSLIMRIGQDEIETETDEKIKGTTAKGV